MKKILFSSLFVAAILSAVPVNVGAQTLYPVVVNGRWGFTDKSGQTAINPQFEKAGAFAAGLAPVRMGRWGYADASGKMQINPQFDRADAFSEGLAAVKLGGGPGPYAPYPYYDPRPYAPFHGGGRFGYIDTNGKLVINPQFEDAGMFSGGLAPVKMGRWGFVDKSGKVVINPQFDRALPFSEGLAAVKSGKLWGFVDKSGKLAINPQFEEAGSFVKNLAPVKQGKKWGFIDPPGNS